MLLGESHIRMVLAMLGCPSCHLHLSPLCTVCCIWM